MLADRPTLEAGWLDSNNGKIKGIYFKLVLCKHKVGIYATDI